MLTRIISAFVALPLFFVVVYFLPDFCLPMAISVLSVVAVYELLCSSKIVCNKGLLWVSYVFSAIIPLVIYFKPEAAYLYAVIFLIVFCNFALWLIRQKEIFFKDIAVSVFATVVIPTFFSALIGIFLMEKGEILILLPFIAAWITDTGAYFAGVFFGKHKLAPDISPKKTVEGSIGGIILCIIAFLAFGYIFNAPKTAYLSIAVSGLILSVISQIGDLSMSVIKREYGIKDYGVIFPGHGGVLDRFDSVLFTSPATYILLGMVSFIGM